MRSHGRGVESKAWHGSGCIDGEDAAAIAESNGGDGASVIKFAHPSVRAALCRGNGRTGQGKDRDDGNGQVALVHGFSS